MSKIFALKFLKSFRKNLVEWIMSYGPQLPAHLLSKESSNSNTDDDDEHEQSYGPKLPSTACRGPDPRRQEFSDSGGDNYGPKLPSKPCFGPQKPEMSTSYSTIGPQIPSSSHGAKDESSSEDDDVIGPMLPKAGGVVSQTEAKREEAAVQRMQDKLDGMGKVPEPKRESWMTELPQSKAKNFGLGPRSFSKSTNPKTKQDKSWTETPEDRARREAGISKNDNEQDHEQDDDVLEYMASLKRDSEMEKASKELNKKRGTESLLDMHSKKLKQKEKEEKKPKERRPFDRDVDLQANRFDEARKKAMIKKASNLDSRFSHGEKKFI